MEVTMAKHRFIILTLLLTPVSTALAQDDYWGTIEHGTSTKIGEYEFYRDGTSSTRIGDMKFYSDGKTENTIGEYTFRSDGKSSIKIGDHTLRSDGRSGVDIGNTHFYQGGSVTTLDGYKFRDK
jgi:hypothetical protein